MLIYTERLKWYIHQILIKDQQLKSPQPHMELTENIKRDYIHIPLIYLKNIEFYSLRE